MTRTAFRVFTLAQARREEGEGQMLSTQELQDLQRSRAGRQKSYPTQLYLLLLIVKAAARWWGPERMPEAAPGAPGGCP